MEEAYDIAVLTRHWTTTRVSRMSAVDDESVDAHLLPRPESNPIPEAGGCPSAGL